MKTNLKLAALATATVLALPLAGLASDRAGFSQDTADQVRAMLTEQGYEVRKIDFEDGLYEAYAIKDGKRMEVYVTAQMQVLNGDQDGKDHDND